MCRIVIIFLCGLNLINGQELFPKLPLGVPRSEDFTCKNHSDSFVAHFNNFTLWAHEMWDSTAKSSSGVLRGNLFNLGNFQECLTSRAPFSTQYCLVTIVANIPKPNNTRDPLSLYFQPGASVLERLYKYEDNTQQPRNVINFGWCTPKSCTPENLEISLQEYMADYENIRNISYTVQTRTTSCQNLESQQLDSIDISFCILSTILVLAALFATVVDFFQDSKATELNCLVYSFSLRRNFKELSKIDNQNPPMKILYGLRTISIFVIITAHRFGTFTSSAIMNFDYIEEQYRSPLASFLFHGDLFVDTFFLLSGWLVTYGMLNHLEKRKLRLFFIIFSRYIRLTPVYAFVIFYYATLFNFTGSGPLWNVIAGQDSKDCRANWWTNLLYVNNYVHADHMCMTHSWYLPCDFHYFIIAIGIIYIIKKNEKIGLSILFGLTLTSIVIPFIITVVYSRPALLRFYPDFLRGPKTHPDFLLTYSKSHTRATPYFVGMFAGYLYYVLKDSEHLIRKVKSLAIIFISVCLILASILGAAVFYNPYHEYNKIEAGSYAALHRFSWSLGSLGLLYVISFGYWRFLYKILSWSPLVPLSKLVYGAYLIHMQFQLRYAASLKSSQTISYFDIVSVAVSDIVLAFISGLLLYLGIEAPCKNIFRSILNSKNKRMSNETTVGKSTTERFVHNENKEESRL